MGLKHICRMPGCTNLADMDTGYCSKHKEEGAKRKEEHDRRHREWLNGQSHSEFKELYATERWKRLKRQVIADHPWCSKCGVSENLEVHHMQPHRGDEELFYDEDNLQVLCHDCHFKETLKEIKQRNAERKECIERKKRGQTKLWY